MRDYVPRVHAAAGELVILGNGSPEQAAWFVEEFAVETPVFTDPKLASHTIAGTRQMMLLDPRTALAAAAAFARGFRQTGVKGSATRLGGIFVISPDGRTPYRYLSRFAGDHPDVEDALRALESEARPDHA